MGNAYQQVKGFFWDVFSLEREDRWVIDFLFGGFFQSRIGIDTDLTWAIHVAPSGSGKTEKVRPFTELPWVIPITSISEKGLLSGTRGPDGLPISLARKALNKVLVVEEMSTLTQMRDEAVNKLFADLRPCADGRYLDNYYGTGESHTKASFGFVGCGTQDLDKILGGQGGLGSRFLIFRGDRKVATLTELNGLGLKRSDKCDTKPRWRGKLVSNVLKIGEKYTEVQTERPEIKIPEEQYGRLGSILDLLSKARVLPDFRGRTQDPETPSRIPIQLRNLVDTKVILEDRSYWNWDDYYYALRVGLDCLHPEVINILGMLAQHDRITPGIVSDTTNISEDWATALLRQLTRAQLTRKKSRSMWSFLDDAKLAWKRADIQRVLPGKNFGPLKSINARPKID